MKTKESRILFFPPLVLFVLAFSTAILFYNENKNLHALLRKTEQNKFIPGKSNQAVYQARQHERITAKRLSMELPNEWYFTYAKAQHFPILTVEINPTALNDFGLFNLLVEPDENTIEKKAQELVEQYRLVDVSVEKKQKDGITVLILTGKPTPPTGPDITCPACYVSRYGWDKVRFAVLSIEGFSYVFAGTAGKKDIEYKSIVDSFELLTKEQEFRTTIEPKWGIFTSTLGYSMQIPLAWHQDKTADSTKEDIFTSYDPRYVNQKSNNMLLGDIKLVISKHEKSEGESLDQWLKRTGRVFPSLTKKVNMCVGVLNVAKIRSTDMRPNPTYYYIESGDSIFEIDLLNALPEQYDLLNKILISFKILDTE